MYGAALAFDGTEYTASGLIGGDSVTGLGIASAGGAASAPAGVYLIVPGGASGSGLGNYAVSYVPGSLTVARAPVGIEGVSALSRAYDGTAAAALTGGVLSGLVNGDVVGFTAGSGVFSSASAGTWPVAVSGYALAATGVGTNYTLTAQPFVADASITPAPVPVAGGLAGVGKVYDGMDSALIASNGVVLAGILAGDAGRVGLSTNGYSARFPGPGAGSNLTVRVENLSLTGDLAADYALVQPVLLGGVDLRAQPPVVAAAPTAAPPRGPRGGSRRASG